MVYKEMYLILFRAVTKALDEIARQNYQNAADCLVHAQQTAEEVYINADEA